MTIGPLGLWALNGTDTVTDKVQAEPAETTKFQQSVLEGTAKRG